MLSPTRLPGDLLRQMDQLKRQMEQMKCQLAQAEDRISQAERSAEADGEGASLWRRKRSA